MCKTKTKGHLLTPRLAEKRVMFMLILFRTGTLRTRYNTGIKGGRKSIFIQIEDV